MKGDGSASDPLRQRLEQILLGGRRKYSRLDVVKRTGVSAERGRRLWRALGFPSVADDEVVFTDADVEAVRTVDQLVRSGLIDPDLEVPVTRAAGQHLSRLAEWQIHLLWTFIMENQGLDRDERQITRFVDRLLPDLERVQSFVWRRHLAAYAGRALAAQDEGLQELPQVVGFVDMVGYTRLTRQLDETALSEVLDRFEALVTDIIAERRGQVVKMIGDEVLFMTDSPTEAAEIGLTLTEHTNEDDGLPLVRVGMAAGQVLRRFGDIYGPVVNLASRLTSVAKPGSVLVDKELTAELENEPGFELRPRRPISVRGYSRLRPFTLHRRSR